MLYLPAGFAAKRQTACIKFTQRPKISIFAHRGNSLHWFTRNLAWPTGKWVHLAVWNIVPIGAWGRYVAQIGKIPLLVKIWPAGRTFDRILQTLAAFMHPTILQKYFKFDVMRFMGYRVIAEKQCVSHLPQIFPCTLQEKLLVWIEKWLTLFVMVSTSSITMQSLEDRTTRAGCRCENVEFVRFLSVCHALRPAGRSFKWDIF